MRPATLTKILASCGWLVLLVSGCVFFRPSWPLLYKPSCDLSPVLTVHLPEHIDTLTAVPKDKMIVENGINVPEGTRNGEGLKELFFLTKGDIKYQFDLFFSDSAAVHLYEAHKHYPFTKKYHPVFQEITADDCSGSVFYTEQPRADPEGGSAPMGYYISRASFRLHNVFIRVTSRDDKPQSDKLTNAVKDLAQMLSVALASTNQIHQIPN